MHLNCAFAPLREIFARKDAKAQLFGNPSIYINFIL
jgi:hypothetical protein